jgi:hypothetical protein
MPTVGRISKHSHSTRSDITHLDKVISQHIPNPPALVRVSGRQLNIKLRLDFLRREVFGDSDEIGDRQ